VDFRCTGNEVYAHLPTETPLPSSLSHVPGVLVDGDEVFISGVDLTVGKLTIW
jgi:hypothetical protein